MVAIDQILAAAVPGLMMVTVKISSPLMTPAVFNNWYTNVHVRDMVQNNFATLALRYTNYSLGETAPVNSTITPASNYLSLYECPDINFINAPGTMNKLPLTHDSFPDKTKPVTTWSDWTFTYWTPQQTFEGNSTATTRPAFALAVKIEPADGGDDDLDQWYRKEHLNKLATLPGYRRTTRWKSSNGSKPRFLAIHELDTLNLDPQTVSDVTNTDWAKKVLGGAKIYEHATYGLIIEKGNPQAKLG